MRGFEHLGRRSKRATATPNPRIKLDWKAYYQLFCEKHGNFPMEDGGRLLFPDGWTYSSTDYMGPEWPPPEDKSQRLHLILQYWRIRRKLVKDELAIRRGIALSLQEAMGHRSVPLQRITSSWVENDDGERMQVYHRGPIDLDAMRIDIGQVEQDLALCDEEIRHCIVELRLHKLELKNVDKA